MAETIKVPGVGQVKRAYVIAGGALVVGIVGYAWWSRGSGGGDVPAYSEEDISDVVTDTPGGSAGSPANSGGDSTDGSTDPDSDAEWVNLAASLLEGSYELTAIHEALGLYITGQPLTSAQERIVRAAIGVAGYPPGGRYAITPITTPSPSALTEPTGVKVASRTSSSVSLSWSAVSGASGYRIYRGSTRDGESSGTSYTDSGLSASSSYTWQVSAVDASGKEGPKSSGVRGTTLAASKPPASTPKPSGAPRHRTWLISPANRTLSALVASYNKRYGTRHTWEAIWQFNLKYRPASTVKTLKSRGPHKVVLGSAFWFPY